MAPSILFIFHERQQLKSLCQSTSNYLKMTKIRSVTFLMVIVSSCALILSFTDAYPTTEVSTEPNPTQDTTGNANNTGVQFAITHIVRTIEFEVGILQDDDTDPSNATDVTTQEYIETDIKLLNVDLLRELLASATSEEVQPTTNTLQQEDKLDSVDKTKTEKNEPPTN